jgi:tetratricopeptide (TPR) repeat protein
MPSAAVLAVLALLLADTPMTEGLRRAEAQRHFTVGQEHMQAELFDQAVREFKAAIALDPLLVLAHYNLGQAHMALKAYPDAVQAYLACRDAIEKMDSLQQGQSVNRDQEIDDQIRELEQLLRNLQRERRQDSRDNVRTMMVESRIRVLEGLRGKGKNERTRIPAELYVALGSAYYRQGALADAEREYTEAIKTDSRMGPAHNNLAVIYMLTGRYKEARVALQKAEKNGFAVNPNLKRDLAAREAGAGKF